MPRMALPAHDAANGKRAGIVSPSILSCDFAILAAECKRLMTLGADWLHVDVMDGNFVPNLTMGAPVVKALRGHTAAFLDCHIMTTHPEFWIKDFAAAGADMFTFHLEAVLGNNLQPHGAPDARVMELVRLVHEAGMYAGIAIQPTTPAEAVLPYCLHIDMVLVMTVNPGFGGQAYMPACAEKGRVIRALHPQLHIQVDGGLSPSTVEHAAACGANVIVAGTAILGADDPGAVIQALRDAVTHQ